MSRRVRIRCRCYALTLLDVGRTQVRDQNGTSKPVTGTPIPWVPRKGPGSDKEAWVAFARKLVRGSEEAQEVLDEQAAHIVSLEVEVAQLRAARLLNEGRSICEASDIEHRLIELKHLWS